MSHNLLALEIPYRDPLLLLEAWKNEPYLVFLDSAIPSARIGRFSFLAVDPFAVLSAQETTVTRRGLHVGEETYARQGDPFGVLAEELKRFPCTPDPELPPFQGGAAGYFGYDLCHHLEKLPLPARKGSIPDMIVGLYDTVIAWDHLQSRCWLLVRECRGRDAMLQKNRWKERLDAIPSRELPPLLWKEEGRSLSLTPTLDRAAYDTAIRKVLAYLRAGDLFQTNLSIGYATPLDAREPFALYRRLRHLSPAPFAAYLSMEGVTLLSSSPERLLCVQEGWADSRPIKGTRPRGDTAATDRQLARALLQSDKDRAEHLMIVDLVRNDLSRVCMPHTVRVPDLFRVESYAHVHHMVSTVVGKLRPQETPLGGLQALFPGGSITGAPKVRAMEILTELEPTARGPFFGSIGYVGYDGSLDTNLAIRTMAVHNGFVTFQAGGGVVIDSDPDSEYNEIQHKARALIHALHGHCL